LELFDFHVRWRAILNVMLDLSSAHKK
jgi:hypothetical protein